MSRALAPVLLVSCVRCQRLHAPLRAEAAHPLCGRCALPGARSAARPGRPHARRAG